MSQKWLTIRHFPTSLPVCAAFIPGIFSKTTTNNHSNKDVC